MKKFSRNIIFMKQDICTLSNVVLIMLSLISGGSIIYSMEFLKGDFRIDNIYAMYATISELFLMYAAANMFGKEFHYRTINMMRVSKKSCAEILIRKLVTMVILSEIVGMFAFAELQVYGIVFNHKIESANIFKNIAVAYWGYGLFLFALATLVVMIVKSTLTTFISVIVLVSLSPIFMNILANFKTTEKLLEYIPFGFMRDAFAFAKYDTKQVFVLIAWSAALLVISNKLFKDRGYA